MKITALKAQVRIPGRVNVFIDGAYRLSLDAMQVIELGVRIGKEYDEESLQELENEGQFSRVYTRSLEYALARPRSVKELKDYLYRKTRDTRTKMGTVKKGISQELAERVLTRLIEKGYVDDEKFARFWVENRNVRKGSSLKKLQSELAAKGVSSAIVASALDASGRSDSEELRKIYLKKRARYDDEQKLIAYLARQGFSYDDIKSVIAEDDEA
jgi:regulatory protein